MNFLQESQIMRALYETQAKTVKVSWYEYCAEQQLHRVVVDYQSLDLSTWQEKRLRAALEGTEKVFISEHTGIANKDARAHITLLDFRSKASARHFLLILETKLAELERADFLQCQEVKKAKQEERLQRRKQRPYTKALGRRFCKNVKASRLLRLIFFNDPPNISITQQDKCSCMNLM